MKCWLRHCKQSICLLPSSLQSSVLIRSSLLSNGWLSSALRIPPPHPTLRSHVIALHTSLFLSLLFHDNPIHKHKPHLQFAIIASSTMLRTSFRQAASLRPVRCFSTSARVMSEGATGAPQDGRYWVSLLSTENNRHVKKRASIDHPSPSRRSIAARALP